MRLLLRIGLVCAALALTVPAHVAGKDADAIEGVYTCTGKNPEGTPYSGLVEIRQTKNTYHARWTFPHSEFRAVGAGFVRDGRLVIAYSVGDSVIVAVYDIKGKTLKGHWTAVGDGDVYEETLERQPAGVTVPDPTPQPQSTPDEHHVADERIKV